MRMVRDRTARLPLRPHYESSELDFECEQIITQFLRGQRGTVSYPISTDDLWVLIGRETSSIDPYADLTTEGASVDGVTDFLHKEKPRVRIAAELSNDSRRENRLRTTITHEYGHVKFHAPLWRVDAETLPLFGGVASTQGAAVSCRREAIVDGSVMDWMEWQAGYICGAILMPITPMRRLFEEVIGGGCWSALQRTDECTARMIAHVQDRFTVSGDAALVRLIKLGYVVGERGALTLPL